MEELISVILIEDDSDEVTDFENYIAQCDGIKLIASTSHANEGIELVRTHLPDAVILDLQLNKGTGSGLEFISAINNIELSMRPCIFVTTSNTSRPIKDLLNKSNVTFIFYKDESDYGPQKVIENIKILQPVLRTNKDNYNASLKASASPEALKKSIYNKINRELELIGISPKMNGKDYLADAIYLLFTGFTGSVFDEIAKNNNKASCTISQGMNWAIAKAWRETDIYELNKYYTAKVSSERGIPTATEFIYYYVNKLKNSL